MPDLTKHSPSAILAELPLVAIVGAGGLAHAFILALLELAPPPLELLIIDPDLVELSNLNRQVLFGVPDIGCNKAVALAERARSWVAKMHPERATDRLSADPRKLDSSNISELLRDATLVIDATDSIETKFILNDHCMRNNISLCYAGVSGYEALALMINPGRSACLRCLFGDYSAEEARAQSTTCQQQGVFGPLVGLTGAVQATLALPFLKRRGTESTRQELFRISQHPLQVRTISAHPRPDCPLGCGLTEQLDLTAEQCPLTFLYTKLALEKLPKHRSLTVTFSSLASAENVSRSVAEEGFQAEMRQESGAWQVAITRRES